MYREENISLAMISYPTYNPFHHESRSCCLNIWELSIQQQSRGRELPAYNLPRCLRRFCHHFHMYESLQSDATFAVSRDTLQRWKVVVNRQVFKTQSRVLLLLRGCHAGIVFSFSLSALPPFVKPEVSEHNSDLRFLRFM
jgi:hypothetical protein